MLEYSLSRDDVLLKRRRSAVSKRCDLLNILWSIVVPEERGKIDDDEERVKANTGSEAVHAATVNGVPHPFHENDRLPRMRGKHGGRGRGAAVLVLAIITQAAR
ncbi:PREDICTED: uncharacterized protein LOC105151644 [Acromyrmex echinatior]|uniref:uncharacterized protein LOC105151644 n=1 Tax=Acromyrmex echinatior TaxID=103372 RepID=UPI000580BAB1|nr:PREDICTED: uncharacterized protein LOC105151644 [Acromyrmex echinatior]